MIKPYICDDDNAHIMVTQYNSEDGTIPFKTKCIVPGCRGTMTCHAIFTGDRPITHEWYKPSKEEMSRVGPLSRQHVGLGGLILRLVEVPWSKFGKLVKDRPCIMCGETENVRCWAGWTMNVCQRHKRVPIHVMAKYELIKIGSSSWLHQSGLRLLIRERDTTETVAAFMYEHDADRFLENFYIGE